MREDPRRKIDARYQRIDDARRSAGDDDLRGVIIGGLIVGAPMLLLLALLA